MPIESLITFMIASALLSLAPGPDNIFVLTQSSLYGKKSGILITLGLCTGLVFHATAVALGLAAIFQTSTIAFTTLKLLGAAYLAYLAWQAFHASSSQHHAPTSTLRSAGALYRRGIIMNISNPKVSIFFLAFLPQFTSPKHGHIAPQIFLLSGIFIGIALVVFSGIALLSGSLSGWLHKSPKTQMYLNRVAATVLGLLALKLATTHVEI